MTAIFYPDCFAASASGRFLLEARSPHNGAIPHRDGRPASEGEFPVRFQSHQCNFRYRLIERTSRGDEIVWERWQRKGEDSPHELLVSDDGWSILRLHGFRPELVVVTPAGHRLLRVCIQFPPDEIAADTEDVVPDKPRRHRATWQARGMRHTTAGYFWSLNGWPYFFHHGGQRFFAWRASWGARLLINLDTAALVTDDAVAAGSPLALAMDETERRGVTALLARLTPRLNEIQSILAADDDDDRDDDDDETTTDDDAERRTLRGELGGAIAAIHLVGVHGLRDQVPILRAWEPLASRGCLCSVFAFGSGWWLKKEYFRPIVQHTLRMLGEVPRPYPAFGFQFNDEPPMDVPASGPDRSLHPRSLSIGAAAGAVLRALGAPDFVHNESHLRGDVYHWLERWDYDFFLEGRWKTLRITFEEGEPEGHVVRIDRDDSDWLHNGQREAAIVGM